MNTAAGIAALTERYAVRFFSAAHSRAQKGGVRVSYFTDKVAAESFACGRILYGKPAKAEAVTAQFAVRYANPGTKIGESKLATFATRHEAEAFAAVNKMFSKGCIVETV